MMKKEKYFMEQFFTNICQKNFNILKNLVIREKLIETKDLIKKTENLINYEIEIYTMKISGFSFLGKVVPNPNKFIIYLNGNMDYDLNRFVLGHEIGHILNSFEYTRSWPTERLFTTKQEEKICDYIGLELTNPNLEFLNRIRKYQNLSGKILIDDQVLSEYIKKF